MSFSAAKDLASIILKEWKSKLTDTKDGKQDNIETIIDNMDSEYDCNDDNNTKDISFISRSSDHSPSFEEFSVCDGDGCETVNNDLNNKKTNVSANTLTKNQDNNEDSSSWASQELN